ncbi:copper resistance protein CopC [Microbacterium sp. NPDC096154]|uniref:copper resistance CopC family protein n=1 Tax=Microbacterium sp. NPDC096154 TaxID=3155549 RepID=UPI003316B8F6
MPAPRSSHLHRLLTLGVCALAALLGPLVVASPAAAHDQLTSADPSADSTVEVMPDTLTLTFSDALISLNGDETVVEVVSPSGADAADGRPEVEGAIVRQALASIGEPGRYTVTWRVVSSDGHPTSGTFGFDVANASATGGAVAPENDETATAPPPRKNATPTPAASSPSPSVETPPASTDAPSDAAAAPVLPWIMLGITAAAVVGVVAALLVSRRRGGPARGEGGGRDDDPAGR